MFPRPIIIVQLDEKWAYNLLHNWEIVAVDADAGDPRLQLTYIFRAPPASVFPEEKLPRWFADRNGCVSVVDASTKDLLDDDELDQLVDQGVEVLQLQPEEEFSDREFQKGNNLSFWYTGDDGQPRRIDQ